MKVLQQARGRVDEAFCVVNTEGEGRLAVDLDTLLLCVSLAADAASHRFIRLERVEVEEKVLTGTVQMFLQM